MAEVSTRIVEKGARTVDVERALKRAVKMKARC
jgi:hypothetical protein